MALITLNVAGYHQPIIFNLEGADYANLQKFPGETDEQRVMKALWLARDYLVKETGNRALLDPKDDEYTTLKKLPGKTHREKVQRAIDIGAQIRDRAVELLAGVKTAVKEKDPDARRRRLDKIMLARKGLWVPK